MIYPLFYQKPYHCAMACLQMVIFRRFGELLDQEELGQRFGVKVPVKLKEIYVYDLPNLSWHNKDEGVSTMECANAFNEFFQERRFPLEATAFLAEKEFLEELGSWIREVLENGDDVWVEYAAGPKGTDKVYLHDSLVDSFDTETGIVGLVDPDPDSLNRRTLTLEELKDRMSGSYGKMTGVLKITPTRRHD